MRRDVKRDSHVTVTRDKGVTSHEPCHATNDVLSRVSHATTTTPHHTISLVSSVLGRCVQVPKPSCSLYRARQAFGSGDFK